MRLYKVILLMNLAVGIGFLLGSLWWVQQVEQLERTVTAPEPGGTARPSTARCWPAQGIVRVIAPEINRIFIEHGDIPGLMEAMTMAFEPADPNILNGLAAGDRVHFTLEKQGDRLTLIAIQKGWNP